MRVCFCTSLYRISLVRAPKATFKIYVFDALEGTRNSNLLGEPFRWCFLVLGPCPAPPFCRTLHRADAPVVCLGFKFHRWKYRKLYFLCSKPKIKDLHFGSSEATNDKDRTKDGRRDTTSSKMENSSAAKFEPIAREAERNGAGRCDETAEADRSCRPEVSCFSLPFKL